MRGYTLGAHRIELVYLFMSADPIVNVLDKFSIFILFERA